MSKIINFDTGKARQDAPTATAYWLCRNDTQSKEISRYEFTGEEHIKTICPGCGENFWIDLYEFFHIAANGFCFHSTQLYCSGCSAKEIDIMDFPDIPEDTATSIDRSTPEFMEAALAVSDYLNDLPLSNVQHNKLIELMCNQVDATEKGAFLQAFDLGIKVALSKKVQNEQ